MILVAGLAVAGLAGIAAAFYFSVRPGSSRARAARPGRAGADGLRENRNRAPHPSFASSVRSASSARSAGPAGRTAGRVADFGGTAGSHDDQGRPVAARTRHAPSSARTRAAARPAEPGPGRQAPAAPAVPAAAMAAGGMNGTSGQPKPGSRSAGYLSPAADVHHGADAAEAAKEPRSRRRVGWRNGAEVDRELWPVEAFGGVTDEQFWDDLAADKPLATTARTAQPDSGSRRRPLNNGPRPAGRPAGLGAYSPSRPGPADRTAIQPIQAAPVLASTPAQPAPPVATQPAPIATQLAPVATQPAPVATQPMRAARQPAASPGRPRAEAGGFADSSASRDDDPLTSPAYSLRPKGAVNGRSYPSSRRSRKLSWEQYEAAISQQTQTPSLAGAHAATSGYADGMSSFGQFGLPAGRGKGGAHEARSGCWPDPFRSDASQPRSSDLPGTIAITVHRPGPGPGDADGGAAAYAPEQPYGVPIQTMDTPPYGEMYGSGSPAGLGGGPRRPNGTWGYGQPGGGIAGGGSWDSRHMYPPANGYRSAYDTWGNGRRLGSLRLPRAHWGHA